MPKKKKLSLPRPGDPLVLSDGRVIQPERLAAHPSPPPTLLPSEFRPNVQRSVKDLPVPAASMNGIACVLVYTIMGLGDREIADAMNVSPETVVKAKESQAYEDAFKSMADAFISANSELIHARIAAYGHDALTSLADVALHGKNEAVRGRYSADLLDRGGWNAKANRGVDGANDLRIVITNGDETTVDIKMGDIGGM